MGTTSLGQFLKSLCCGSCWNYAAFWKLQHESQMFLTWEDGYCDTPKQGHSTKYTLDSIPTEGLPVMSACNYESSTCDGTMGGDIIDAAVAYMSNVQYPLGEGVVGKVASTGNYCWVLSGDILSGEFNFKLLPQYPDEWLYQFAAGIKTILLVPVVPHGVLQLGSLESIVEDAGMVALIKEKFSGYQSFVENSESVTINKEFLAPSSSLLMSPLIGNLDGLSALSMGVVKSEDSLPINNFKPTILSSFTENPVTAMVTNPSTVNDISTHLGLNEEPDVLSEGRTFSRFGMMGSTMYRWQEEKLQDFSCHNNSSMGIFGEVSDRTTMKDATDYTVLGPSLNFPVDCELHKALAPGFMVKANDYPLDSSLSGKDVNFPSSLFRDGDLIFVDGGMEDNGRLVNSDDQKRILEPSVIQSAFRNPTINSGDKKQILEPSVSQSGKSFGLDSSTTYSGEFSASIKGHNQSETSGLSGEESTLSRSNVTTAFRNPTVSSSTLVSSYGSMMSDVIEEDQKKNYGYSNPKKISKVCGASKRKGNPGDNKKPRLRDRQLIQDRLKELRELVPHGAKCSIDGLLDRTVAHMLFLQSVSDRAEKLKRWEHKEGVNRKNKKSPEQNGGCQSGTSWAFELGTDQQVCPIIVEDLECPGHMLIEMICDENDRFLEIAEVIHGLNLTILKGVMEKRSDNTWAHFLIEAPRGLHRLDIFWPLMKLLQQNQSPISSKI